MDKKVDIEKLKRKMISDKKLPFRTSARQLVFGEGNLNPKLYILGEAPGKLEDESGRPFIGRSGQLLRSQIRKAGFFEKDLYITSVVRFRPPNNKTPTSSDVAAYEKYVNTELSIIKPKIILTVGAVALRKFSKIPITKLHGKPIKSNWNGRKFLLIPMFHPAAALRNTKIRKMFYSDFIKLKRYLRKT